MRRLDRVSSLFWLLVGAGFLVGGRRYGFGSLREPGAGLLPILFGALLVLLSGILFLKSLGRDSEGEQRAFWLEGGNRSAILLTLLALVAYTGLFKPLGFAAATFLFIFFLLKFIGRKRWAVSVAVALLLSLSCYGLFSLLLGTPLPKGTLYGCALGTALRV